MDRRAAGLHAVDASEDAAALSLEDGRRVRVSTVAGSEEIVLEITDTCRPGQVVMPHGFGLVHGGETYGANVNRLTPAAHRDPLAATPYHKLCPVGWKRCDDRLSG